MARWTKRERDAFTAAWLRERRPHDWDTGSPTRCRRCGAKYGKQAAGRACQKKRKPNRWRLHLQRAILRAQYPPRTTPVVRNADWILCQLRSIAQIVRTDGRYLSREHGGRFDPEDPRHWKYHRIARRYRALLRAWWALPAVPAHVFDTETVGGSGSGWWKAGRTRLIKRVLREQRRIVQDGDTVYTFYPDAKVTRPGEAYPRDLFTREEETERA